MLSIRPSDAWIARLDIATNNIDAVNRVMTEPEMIVGHPVLNRLFTVSERRSYIGIQDRDNNNHAETLFFYVSVSATERQAFNAVQEIGYRSIISMDGGPSAQMTCAGTAQVPGTRPIPQAFLVADLAHRPIHRSYRNAVPDHLYGHDPNEGRPYGYTLEQANYFWLAQASGGAAFVPLYRCLWGGSRHLVTRDANCEGAGTREALLGYGLSWQAPGTIPLHRLLNPGTGDHLYTTSETERRNVAAAGWVYEGVSAYVWTSA
jgi:hypothetical protein